MEQLVALCRRRGFLFQSSEIYGGLQGFWDYGPLGVELKRNVREAWWRDMVAAHNELEPPAGAPSAYEMVGLDCSIIMHPQVWKCSGHYDLFHDFMQTCRQCKKLFRSDHVWEMLKESDWVKSFATTTSPGPQPDRIRVDGGSMLRWAKTKGKKVAPGLALVRNPEVTLSWLVEHIEKNPDEVLSIPTILQFVATEQFAVTGLQTPCPACGGDLTEPREFNLMMETYTSPIRDESTKAFLRPETAQGIFVNFKNVLDSSRVRIPFGIAQIGKSFRNEITPRNFTFRSREFEQMEIEFFCRPETSPEWYRYWRDRRYKWYVDLGLAGDRLRLRDHEADELSHYSCGTADIEYAFPFLPAGEFGELEGVAHRGDFDLRSHAEGKLVRKGDDFVVEADAEGNPKYRGSGKDLNYFDDQTKERFIPHVIEPSAGADRAALAFLCEAYREDEAPDEHGKPVKRVFLKLHPRLAPIKAAVFPLVKKDGMPEIARDIYKSLKPHLNVFYDEKSAVGRRYRRQDEIGTPFCITVDSQTLQDGTVTIRDRDTLEQCRIHKDACLGELQKRLIG
ncbi:MAG: glycine--tRNA ligase [Pirellulales bacterium]|nr:glycine--tRNA ligase [Pirellulales bacterium]